MAFAERTRILAEPDAQTATLHATASQIDVIVAIDLSRIVFTPPLGEGKLF